MPKLITVSQNLLEDLLPYLKGTKYDDKQSLRLRLKIQALLDNTNKRSLRPNGLKHLTQDITYFPKKAKNVSMEIATISSHNCGLPNPAWLKVLSIIRAKREFQDRPERSRRR